MSKREKLIAAVLLVMIGIWVLTLFSRFVWHAPKLAANSAAGSGNAAAAAAKTAGPADNLGPLAGRVRLGQETLAPEELRDPFKKLEPSMVASNVPLEISELSLTGISLGTGTEVPVVVINDQILKAGDAISGFTVKEIGQNTVKLFKNDKEYTLNLYRE